MKNKKIFPRGLYFRKFLNTFTPRILFRMSPRRKWDQWHWRSQNVGDIHGFDKYTVFHPRISILISEISARSRPEDRIIDIGCNCGFYLSHLRKAGFKNLTGVDISPSAIQYGKEHFDLNGVELITGSFEEKLPYLQSKDVTFDIVYSMGATIELVHPAFDIVGNICRISNRYVILIINEWGHKYTRFWEYEFNKNGYGLIKYICPYDGVIEGKDFTNCDSLMVFEKIR